MEHALKEIPQCVQAVMFCGSYANTDKASGIISNQRVISEALHLTPVPTLTFMSPTDLSCGLVAQPAYWANLMTAAVPIDVSNHACVFVGYRAGPTTRSLASST